MNCRLFYSGYHDETLPYPFIVDPNFYYITSCDLPNLLLLIQDSQNYVYSTTHVDPQDTDTYQFQLHHCFRAKVITLQELQERLTRAKHILSTPILKTHPDWTHLQSFVINMKLIPKRLQIERTLKSPEELSNITQACRHTSDAIRTVIRFSKPSMTQIELMGMFRYALSKHNITEMAFAPIISHNQMNVSLHHIPQATSIPKQSFVLIDVGCRYNHYCSDITRCFPISGKFTKLQSVAYHIVSSTLDYALSLLKPGSEWKQITQQTRLYLIDQCIQIKLIKPSITQSEKINLSHQLMPHSLGHHVGLDYHDCGPIQQLKANMVIAVEPGLYFSKHLSNPYINNKVWKSFLPMGGVRLEDTIVITDKGHKNLSRISHKLNDIEKIKNNI